MSEEEKTALEKHGGLLGITGIAMLLSSKILKLTPPVSVYMTLAGLSVLVVGCVLLGIANIRKKEPKNKAFAALIFLIILYNLVFVYRAVFVTGRLAIF
jgi:hypothetical protein